MKDSRVYLFDTTLRDGEQCPGAAMSEEEKIAIAHQLAKLGIDIIEAGFPISSEVQFRAVERISQEVEGPTICALARALKEDIDAAYKALKPAKKKRIHTFIATSPIHMKYKIGKKPSEVLKMAQEAVRYARELVEEVEFSPEDATRSELPFLCEVVEAAIEEGAKIINIPDTVGYITPQEYGEIFDTLREKVRGIDQVILSAHCHDDLGLATANSLTALLHGARQVEGTINGIGERAGNTALEEIIMAIKVRPQVFPFTLQVNTREIMRTSKLVAKATGFPVPPNKAIVGKNAFAHEAGIHQDGVIKHRLTYEIMKPESIGLEGSQLVLGRHSGRAGVRKKLEEMGFSLTKEQLEKAYQKFLEIADKKKEVYEEDLLVILEEVLPIKAPLTYKLKYFYISSGNTLIPSAVVQIELKQNGEAILKEASATGDGPVSALFRAIEKALEVETRLKSYQVVPVSVGKDALGEAHVEIEIEGKTYRGRGVSTDILEASALAFLEALHRYHYREFLRKIEGV